MDPDFELVALMSGMVYIERMGGRLLNAVTMGLTLRLLLAAGLSFSLPAVMSGCAGTAVDESNPTSLLQDAEEEIKSDHYQIALEKLRVIKNKFPYSKAALDAQLRIADVLFLQESFGEAASAYETFRDLHPKNEKVGYAMYRAAKSYFNDAPSNIARDMTPAQKALDAYNEFLRRFPNAPEASEARKDVSEARRLLAEKELSVARFYFRQDQYESAKGRCQKVLSLYPETDAATEAREKLAQIEAHLAKNPPQPKASESSDKDGQ